MDAYFTSSSAQRAGNRQVRAAKVIENGEVHANYLAMAIEERSAGTAGRCP